MDRDVRESLSSTREQLATLCENNKSYANKREKTAARLEDLERQNRELVDMLEKVSAKSRDVVQEFKRLKRIIDESSKRETSLRLEVARLKASDSQLRKTRKKLKKMTGEFESASKDVMTKELRIAELEKRLRIEHSRTKKLEKACAFEKKRGDEMRKELIRMNESRSSSKATTAHDAARVSSREHEGADATKRTGSSMRSMNSPTRISRRTVDRFKRIIANERKEKSTTSPKLTNTQESPQERRARENLIGRLGHILAVG